MTDWGKLEEQAKGLDYTRSPQAIAQLVHAMAGFDGDLEDLRGALEKAQAREEFSRRAEALRTAREHVAGLPSEQENAKGYRDKAMSPVERTATELRVARYLLGEEER